MPKTDNEVKFADIPTSYSELVAMLPPRPFTTRWITTTRWKLSWRWPGMT